MSPTFELLQKLAAGLGINVSSLVSVVDAKPLLGRRSVTRAGQGHFYPTLNYSNEFLGMELANKRFTPMRTKITARQLSDFQDWSRHAGEDFVFVLDGEVEFHSELYEPTKLAKGDSVYFDSQMGHLFISVSPTDAEVLWITAS